MFFSKLNMADSNSFESSSIPGSEYLDFKASMEGEHNERVYELVSKIRLSRFPFSGRA